MTSWERRKASIWPMTTPVIHKVTKIQSNKNQKSRKASTESNKASINCPEPNKNIMLLRPGVRQKHRT